MSSSLSSSSSSRSRSNSSYHANVGPPGPFCEPPDPHENRAESNGITTFSPFSGSCFFATIPENVFISLLPARFSDFGVFCEPHFFRKKFPDPHENQAESNEITTFSHCPRFVHGQVF